MAAAKQGKKSALLIGINEYNAARDEISNLHGCIRDVEAVETFLRDTAGISNITKLTSPASESGDLPTLESIVREFELLAREAQQDDFIYLHYSGHGTRRDTKFRGFKVNDQDECLVLPRADRKLDYLCDVELAFLLKQIADKGATVNIVLDCCYSGGATRDDDGVRGSDHVPASAFHERDPIKSEAVLRASWQPGPTSNDRGATVIPHWMTSSSGIDFLAACLPDQKAQEIPRNETPRQGLFTQCLASCINQNRGAHLEELSCGAVFNLVAERVKAHPQRRDNQTVVFGGRNNRFFFGTHQVKESTTTITGVETLPGDMTEVKLSGGTASGVRRGDEYAIYPADRVFRDLADYNSPLATCRVTGVRDFTADALVIRNNGATDLAQVQAGCRAVNLREILKSRILVPQKVRVSAAEDVAEERVEEVRRRISLGSKLAQLEEEGTPFSEVRIERDDSFSISFVPDLVTGSKATVRASTIDSLLASLDHLTIYYNLFDLAAGPPPKWGITVETIGFLDRDQSPPPPQPFIADQAPHIPHLRQFPEGSSSINILEEQSIGIKVRNTTFQPLYIEILDLEPSWAASRIYPVPSEAPILLNPNEGAYFFITMSMPEAVADVIVQPNTFDRLIVVATLSDRPHFPEKVLPKLGERERGEPALGDPDDGRGGRGVPAPQWFVRQLDVQVIRDAEA